MYSLVQHQGDLVVFTLAGRSLKGHKTKVTVRPLVAAELVLSDSNPFLGNRFSMSQQFGRT